MTDQGEVVDQACLDCTSLPFDKFFAAMKQFEGLTDHDIITLARYYQEKTDKSLTIKQLLSLAHGMLMKADFADFDRIVHLCQHEDGAR